MLATAYFSEDGSPKTGLSPTLDIIDLSDNSVVINDGAMTEVGQGWYKYTFAGYDNSKDYAILCDSVTLIGSERYAVGSTEDMGDTLQVKAKTVNLPASPAPANEYDTEMAHITADVATEAKQDVIDGIVDDIKSYLIDGGRIDLLLDAIIVDIAALNNVSIADVQTALTNQGYTAARAVLLSNLDATISSIIAALVTVQADLDNPDQYKADVSALALEATVAALNNVSVNDILTAVIEGTITFEQMLRIFLARMAGKASGGGTTDIKFRDLADSKDRIDMTVDTNGDRSAVTLDGS